MKKISRIENIKKDINDEIGFRNKSRNKKEGFKLNDSRNNLNRYDSF